MKKILSVLVVIGALVASAEDSYLYWMLGSTVPYTSSDYTKVRLRATDNDGKNSYLYLYASDATTDNGMTSDSFQEISSSQAVNGAAYYAKLASETTYASFVVELLNDNGFLAQSKKLAYSEALADYIMTAGSLSANMQAWAATAFATPEPNSAMLMMLGFAVLGLRRRRQIKS